MKLCKLSSPKVAQKSKYSPQVLLLYNIFYTTYEIPNNSFCSLSVFVCPDKLVALKYKPQIMIVQHPQIALPTRAHNKVWRVGKKQRQYIGTFIYIYTQVYWDTERHRKDQIVKSTNLIKTLSMAMTRIWKWNNTAKCASRLNISKFFFENKIYIILFYYSIIIFNFLLFISVCKHRRDFDKAPEKAQFTCKCRGELSTSRH